VEFPKLSSTRRQFLQTATDGYYEALKGSPAVDYLLARGITGEVAQRFRLGYVADPLEGHERFKGRLAIPYLTPSGVSGIRFRTIDGSEPKYDQESGVGTPLYNVRDLHRSEPWIAVCEGELDTVVMSGLVGVPAVGIPGVSHWGKSVWDRLLQDYEQVFICVDPDEAGGKIVPDIARRVENPVVIDLPGDVNDTYLSHGADWIRDQMGLD